MMKHIAAVLLLCRALWTAVPARAQAVSTEPAHVLPGIDVLLQERLDLLRGKRVGLVTHAAAVTAGLKLTADALFETPGLQLAALLGPEHGVRGASHAGEKVADQRDPKTGAPIFSLYGQTAKPTPEMLQGVDVLVYDLQDIGARSYTYITTLALVMEAAAEAGKPLVVLDRPDPLGGLRVEGNVPPADWGRNMVCWLRVPYVYGMTPGELAQMINGEGWLAGGKRCDLTVVPMRGWKRSMLFSDTGLIWVGPSPHVPRSGTSLFYALTGLLPGQTISNGVGYTLPFELIGAPWIDGERLAAKLNALALPGLFFRPMAFKPFYATYKGRSCQGVQVHVQDPARAPTVAVTLHALAALQELYPERRIFEEPPPAKKTFFDFLKGLFRKPRVPEPVWGEWESALADPGLRKQLAQGRPVSEILTQWQADVDQFLKAREKYLLYP